MHIDQEGNATLVEVGLAMAAARWDVHRGHADRSGRELLQPAALTPCFPALPGALQVEKHKVVQESSFRCCLSSVK